MADHESMTSNKPFLIRALHEWILDNQMTPFLLVDAAVEGVEVPRQHINDGKIILNVSPNAVQGLGLENEWIFFSARFDGKPYMINVPVGAVLAIYAKENGRGMMFASEESASDKHNPDKKNPDEINQENATTAAGKPNDKKPVLRVIK